MSQSSESSSDPPCNLMHRSGDDFLQYYSGKSGVYFISYEYDDSRPILVKIGLSKYKREFMAPLQPRYWMRSFKPRERLVDLVEDEKAEPSSSEPQTESLTGLGKRIYDYMLCYPTGFYIYAIIETPAAKVDELENSIHQYLVSKNLHSALPHSKSEEWFYIRCAQIPDLVRMFTRANNLEKYCIFSPYYKLAEFPRKRKAFRRITTAMTPKRKKKIESHSKQIITTVEKPSRSRIFEHSESEEDKPDTGTRKKKLDF